MAKREKTKQKQNKDKNMKNKKMFLPLLTAGGLVLAGATANANSITLTDVGAVLAGTGSDWTYHYSFDNSYVKNGDFMAIPDFGDATLVFVQNPGWIFSNPTSGTGLILNDDGGVKNVVLTWSDLDQAVDTHPGFDFIVHSDLTDLVGHFEQYSTADHSFLDPAKGSFVQGPITVPNQPDNRVPDGGVTIGMLGFALMGVEGLRRKLSK